MGKQEISWKHVALFGIGCATVVLCVNLGVTFNTANSFDANELVNGGATSVGVGALSVMAAAWAKKHLF